MTKQSLSHVYIGTSAWHYRHWRGRFYPSDLTAARMLRYYADRFDTVEINNSFYRLPTPSALEGWCRETPAGFCFAVKASRYITHNLKLKHPKQAEQKFLSRIESLGRRLGPILFQLPPDWKINVVRLGEFLRELPQRHRYTFEFRNPTWHVPEVYDTLRRHRAALCIHEIAGFQCPFEVTADFIYVRLHGPSDKYQGVYSESALRTWANRIQNWRKELTHVFVYFDNDQSGFAAKNVLELKRMLEGNQQRRAVA
jgi:uncharacterized protein YecE (DUF72 family)